MASIPPEEMMAVLGRMVPALCPAERAGLLADLRAHMPPPAFAALGLAPVPGLVQAA